MCLSGNEDFCQHCKPKQCSQPASIPNCCSQLGTSVVSPLYCKNTSCKFDFCVRLALKTHFSV